MKVNKVFYLFLFFIFSAIESHLYASDFFPYSQVAVQRLRALIEQEDLNLQQHKETFLELTDLASFSRELSPAPIGEIIYPPDYERGEGDTERIFRSQHIEISWLYEERRIPCNVVTYIQESKNYIYERYRHLREQALQEITALMDEQNENHENKEIFAGKQKEYQKTIEEIKKVLYLVEKAYPEEFYRVDRLITYTFSHSDEFQRLLEEPGYSPSGELRLSHIQFRGEKWIPFKANLKNYMNFRSHPRIIKSYDFSGTRPDGHNYTLQVERSVSPLEACLTDLSFSLIGFVGKTKWPEAPSELNPSRDHFPSDLPWPWRPGSGFKPERPGEFPFPIKNPHFTDPMRPF